MRVSVHEARKHDFARISMSGGETWLGRVPLRRYTSVIRPVVLSTDHAGLAREGRFDG